MPASSACNNTAPAPTLLASTHKLKGQSNWGAANTGAETRNYLAASKASRSPNKSYFRFQQIREWGYHGRKIPAKTPIVTH